MSEKKVPVIYQQKRKLVNVNLDSFGNVVSAIYRRFHITDDIRLFWKCGENNEYFDIEDDDDLEGLGDVEDLVLLVKSLALDDGKDDVSREQPDYDHQATGHTSSYQDFLGEKDAASCGFRRSSSHMAAEVKITVLYGAKTKKIVVERLNFEAIRNLVANRFKLTDDFQLQVKDESGVMIDIDCDEDAADNMELMHTVWAIPTNTTTIKAKRPSMTEDFSLITVGQLGEYSITETPDYKSKIVIEAAVALQNDICIPSISAKLNEVEECLRIAYYATVDNIELRCKAQNMQFDLQSLCDKCDTTMLKIKLGATHILEELQCGFGYLVDGFEDFGLERLGSVSSIAKEIQNEVEVLRTLLSPPDEPETTPNDDMHNVKKKPGGISDNIEKNIAQVMRLEDEEIIEAKKQKQHGELQFQRHLVKERVKDVYFSRSQIDSFAERERSATEAGRHYQKSTCGLGFRFKRVISFGFYEGNKPLVEQEERFAKEMREQQAEEKKRLDELKEKEMREKIKFDALVARMKAQPKEMSEVAVKGAQDGILTLASLVRSLAFSGKRMGQNSSLLTMQHSWVN